MSPPPRPLVRAIAHVAGVIAVVATAMGLAAILPALIGPVAVLAIVAALGAVAWIGATLATPRTPRAANDNAPPDHMCNWRPYAASTLSCIISDRVGCGKTVSISSASVVSSVLPIV